MNIEKHQEYKKRKKKGKHCEHINNYMDNLSAKQWVKQVKVGEDG